MNPSSWAQGNAGFPGMNNQNFASDGANVGQQIGTNFGDTTIHDNRIYKTDPGDPPDRKFEVAINHLEGGLPRFAEEILDQLLQNGHISTQRAYYFALAALSGRALNEINTEVYGKFANACRIARQCSDDQWIEPLDVVQRVMSALWREGGQRPPDPGKLKAVRDSFTTLPPQRQAEITRHLDAILADADQDVLESAKSHRVMTERMQPNRTGRAWKFFHPEPAKPRQYVCSRPSVATATWVGVTVGLFAALLGLSALLAPSGTPLGAVTSVLLLGVGGYLAVRHGITREQLAARLKRKNLEHGIPFIPQQPVSPGHWVSAEFVKEIHQRVENSFSTARPHVAGNWDGDTRGIREYLKFRFIQLYGNAQVTPVAINWLIKWHAEQTSRQWQSGTLFSYRQQSEPTTRTTALFGVGIALASVGLLVLLASGFGWSAIFLGVGGYILARKVIVIVAIGRATDAEQAENDQLLAAENNAYAAWCLMLSDRPTDAEMARWLDLDKSYLTTTALHRCGLTKSDLVTHVVMTERKEGALRAREIHGPPRYSAYVVLVFLLTGSGVREIEVDLDFRTGEVRDERRTSFRYDALASARVSETGVRVANERAYLVPPPGQPEPLEILKLRSREFRLTLLNGEDIRVVVENFKGFTDVSLENEPYLLRIALDASGIAGALHVLETVAAEGRDWIGREQQRRKHRSPDWFVGDSEPKAPGFAALEVSTSEMPNKNG